MTSTLVLRVEVAGRLVGEDDLGVVHDGAGDRHPLLLAARELATGGARAASPSPTRSSAARARSRRSRRRDAGVDERQLDVLERAWCATSRLKLWNTKPMRPVAHLRELPRLRRDDLAPSST